MVDSGHSVYNEAETYIDFCEQSFGGQVAFVGTIGRLREIGWAVQSG
jgi:hypothetical protein